MGIGSFADFTEEAMLAHIVGVDRWEPPAVVYVALGNGTGDLEEGQFADLSGAGYERVPVVFDAPVSANNVSTIRNCSKVVFPMALEDWASAGVVAIFDAPTDGNMLVWGYPGSLDIRIKKDEQAIFKKEHMVIELFQNYGLFCSQHIQEAILNHIFRAVEYPQPTLYMALGNGSPAFDAPATRANLGEPIDAAYSRVAVPSWTPPVQDGDPTWNSAITFSTLGGVWGTATTNWGVPIPIFLTDDPIAGNWLWLGGTSGPANPIEPGDTVLLEGSPGWGLSIRLS